MFTGFAATRTRPFPAGYILPAAYPEAVSLLQRHGIVVERLEESWTGNALAFRVDSLSVAQRPYQGHRTVNAFGDYRGAEREVPAGSYYVSCAQPLGALVFTMLEPEIQDGLVYWNFFDRGVSTQREVPILKLMAPPTSSRRTVTALIRP
jgi:hypothetical protein